MLDFYLSSEATITVEPIHHANNFWAPIPDNFARIDAADPLQFDVNTLQTETLNIVVYDERYLPRIFDELNAYYVMHGNTEFHESIIFPGGGTDIDFVQFDVTDTRERFYETKKYIFEDLQIEFEEFSLENEAAELTSDLFGFDVSGSIFAQTGFPNFRSVVVITTKTGQVVQTNRNVWIH